MATEATITAHEASGVMRKTAAGFVDGSIGNTLL
jgi:hypothetical protein